MAETPEGPVTPVPPSPSSPQLSGGSPTPASPHQERPKWKQVAVMFFGGIGLAIGGCGMFLATIDRQTPLGVVGGIGFAGGLILILIGGITGLVYMVSYAIRALKSDSHPR